MSFIVEHIEYLIRRHDCIVMPGIGAIMVRNRAARFDNNNPSLLLPPSRELAFNSALSESDGVLESSVARKAGVSFEAARRMVKEESESLLQQLRAFGELSLGHLGHLSVAEYGAILFTPTPAAEWDYRYYGLRALRLQSVDAAVSTVRSAKAEGSAPSVAKLPAVEPWHEDDVQQNQSPRRRISRNIVGIAASLAVIVTLAMFLLNPIKVEKEPLMASMAPINSEAVVETNVKPVEHHKSSVANTQQQPVEAKTTTAEKPQPVANVQPSEQTKKLEATKVETQKVETTKAETTKVENAKTDKPKAVSARFNTEDPFCVVVASFPDSDQAERYIKEHSGKNLGVLQQDGKYRIYAATGSSYEEATSQKALTGGNGAWICRR